MPRLRAMFTFGTRPEAIKMAPLVLEGLRQSEALETQTVFTGQHRQMLDQVAEYFRIRPDLDLDVMRENQSLSGLTARLLTGLDWAVGQLHPNCIVAQGDTTSAMCAAVVAFYHRLPFVHVEAGLRTGDLQSPWPEEFNRRVASLTATLHCAPTSWAAENLLREGVRAETVHVTGNTVVDALLWTVERERARADFWQAKYSFLGDRRLVLITGHRRESFGAGFERICQAILQLAQAHPNVEFLYPVHLNPRVQEPVKRLLVECNNVHLTEPAAYPEFVWLMDRCELILTDSGGVQEEAPSLGKPVLVMRDTTERPEGVEAGVVELVGTQTESILQRSLAHLNRSSSPHTPRLTANPYGDGQACARIVRLMLSQGWESK